jgi:hypothetical protein
VPRYFSGRLLDVSSFGLEQEYLVGTPGHPRRDTAVWLEVDEGDGFRAWWEVTDLDGCDPDDRCFLLDRSAGVVRFGDGRSGRQPSPGANIRGWYRRGAGASGNVPESEGSVARAELVSLLAEVSHFTWMRQAARDKGYAYEELDPIPTEHDRERAEETVAELERIGLLERKRST